MTFWDQVAIGALFVAFCGDIIVWWEIVKHLWRKIGGTESTKTNPGSKGH